MLGVIDSVAKGQKLSEMGYGMIYNPASIRPAFSGLS
jgi:hypothetical protein